MPTMVSELSSLHLIAIFVVVMILFFGVGYLPTYVIWPKGSLDVVERLVWSWCLSLVVLPLLLFLCNRLGIYISSATVWFVIFAMQLGAVIGLAIRHQYGIVKQ